MQHFCCSGKTEYICMHELRNRNRIISAILHEVNAPMFVFQMYILKMNNKKVNSKIYLII